MNKYAKKIAENLFQIRHRLSKKTFTIQPKIEGFKKELVIQHYSWPYQHAVIDEVLEAKALDTVTTYFDSLLKDRVFKHNSLYDLFAVALDKEKRVVLPEILYSNHYLEMVERVLGVQLSKYTAPVFHNNTPRVKDKYIHCDKISVVFKQQTDDGSSLLTRELSGTGVHHFLQDNTQDIPDGFIICERRATTILYLSENWKKGDGGETAIFLKWGSEFFECASVDPRYNRLLIFENTPVAFHNYKACKLENRKSLIQWFHDV